MVWTLCSWWISNHQFGLSLHLAKKQWWVCHCDVCLHPLCQETSFPVRCSHTACSQLQPRVWIGHFIILFIKFAIQRDHWIRRSPASPSRVQIRGLLLYSFINQSISQVVLSDIQFGKHQCVCSSQLMLNHHYKTNLAISSSYCMCLSTYRLPEGFGVHKVYESVANVHSRGSINP